MDVASLRYPVSYLTRRSYPKQTLDETAPFLCRYTLANALSASALFAIFVPLSEATGFTIDQLNQGTGYAYFAIGFGPLILQPASLAFGKRPVYVLSLLISCGLNLWTPFASTYGQWIANRLLIGFFGSPCFSLSEVSISDVVSSLSQREFSGPLILTMTSSFSRTKEVFLWVSTCSSCTLARPWLLLWEASFSMAWVGKLSW